MCVKFQLFICNSFGDMTGSQIYRIGGCWFLPPLKCRRRIGTYGTVVFLHLLLPQQVIWHWRRCTRRGLLELRICKKFSTFTLLGYPLRQRFSKLGGPSYPMFDMVIAYHRSLPSLFLIPIKRLSSKIRRSEDDRGRNLGQNLGHFAPVKRAAAWVEIEVVKLLFSSY